MLFCVGSKLITVGGISTKPYICKAHSDVVPCTRNIILACLFSFCDLGHAQGVGLRGAGVKNLSVDICDGAPSTAPSS